MFSLQNLGGRVAIAQQKAIQWLDRNLKLLKQSGDPYEVALVAYALMLTKTPTAEQAFGILAKHARIIGEYMYWGKVELPQPPTKLENQKYFSLPRLPYEYDSLNIETTGYALLVYASRRELLVEPIVRWLIAQRLTDGGYASTQDTGVALKALIEYTVRTRIRDVSQLSITVEATSLPGQSQTLHISDKNLAQLQSIDVRFLRRFLIDSQYLISYDFNFRYRMHGVPLRCKPKEPVLLSYKCMFNTMSTSKNSKLNHRCALSIYPLVLCSMVEISLTLVTFPVKGKERHKKEKLCANLNLIFFLNRWNHLNESIRSGMAVLDVTLPTGYWIQQQKLDSYILSRRVRNLQRARYLHNKVLFYFDFVSI